MCTSVLTQLCCHELAISVPEALGEKKKRKGLNSSQKWDFNFLEIPICLCMCVRGGVGGRRGEESKGWESRKKEYYVSRVKERTEIMTFKWTASFFSWRLLVKITSHNVIRKPMGTIKVIITVQCVRAGAKLPLCLPLSSQQIIALDNLNQVYSCRNTLHTSPRAMKLIAFQKVIVPQHQISIEC